MNGWHYGAIGLLSLTVLVMLFFALKSRKPIRLFFINAGIGFTVLAAINLTTAYTGIHLPINEWTAAGTAVYGAPAVAGFLLLQIIFR